MRSLRRPLVAFAAIALCAVGGLVVLGISNARASSPGGLTHASAIATVRRFGEQAVVQDDASLACRYLTPAEQARVAALAGPGATCRLALNESPGLLGVAYADQLDHLPVHATVTRGLARVTLSRPGHGALTFLLTPRGPSAWVVFEAPPSPWRIAQGAGQVLTGPSHAPVTPTARV